jgi:hypothetical protein
MRQFLREHYQILVFILLWIIVARVASALMYGLLPLGVLLFRRADRWQDIVFGFIMALVLSDMIQGLPGIHVMKTAKYTYILAMALVLLLDQVHMQPLAKLFTVFLPFFVYAVFPILRSHIPISSLEKTVSYALLFLVVPNYVLYCFRRYGWAFFRNLVWFLVFILLVQKLLPVFGNASIYYTDGRFRGFFGNTNGLAIFCYLTLVLFAVVHHLRRGLFTFSESLFIYALLIYYVIACGARTSLMSTLMFLLLVRFFRISVLLGIVSFVAFAGIGELLSSNLPLIITSLGLQDYLRVDTIADGSGRYIAWGYAWEQLNEQGYFLFGGGFDNEGWLMREARVYLSSLGHQGGVHNSYLAFWLNVGIVGLLIYFRSFILIFIKASKNTSIALAVMFSVLFSILYESWLAGSLNPYTIMLLVILTVMSEQEIIGSVSVEEKTQVQEVPEDPPPLVLPAR